MSLAVTISKVKLEELEFDRVGKMVDEGIRAWVKEDDFDSRRRKQKSKERFNIF